MSSSSEWDELCRQYGDADGEVREAWAVVTRKFGAIAARTSRENPTDEELRRLEDARLRRDAVDRRMRDFMKSHFGVDA